MTAIDDRAEVLARQLHRARIAATQIADARDRDQHSEELDAKYRSVVYLSGPDDEQLNAAESECRAYAREFRWKVLKCTRDNGDRGGLRRLIAELDDLNVHIIITYTLDMISPDQDTRDGLLAAIERSRCIVHPVSTPCRVKGPLPSGRS